MYAWTAVANNSWGAELDCEAADAGSVKHIKLNFTYQIYERSENHPFKVAAIQDKKDRKSLIILEEEPE